ncbi:DUF6712 family protein [uncultured Fibrella sp.]|uniref:DUF6712 family protein n=1 Tax=uncultured Fibrella sp. TaxID=1284596 RepID=UPI0035CA4B94
MLTQDILKAQLGTLQSSMSEVTVKPFMQHAERWFADEVGTDLWTYLKALPPTDAAQAELLRLTQSCLAWQCYSLAFPHQKFRVGDLGMMKASPQNAIAVTKWEYADSRDANLSMLDLSLEYFWRELEIQRPAAWTASSAYQERQRHLIRSAAEFGSLLPIAGRNYRFFQKLLPHLADVENDIIRVTLTTQVYKDLMQKWLAPEPAFSFEEEMLLTHCRKALAYLGTYEAWPYLPLSLNETGISERRDKSGMLEEVAADGNLRQSMRQQLYNDGQKRLAQVRSFLDETATSTLFSSYYQQNLVAGAVIPDDDFTNKPHVIL